MLWILTNQLRAAENEGNSLVLAPLLGAIRAVIDAGASRSMNVLRIRRVDDDAHDVGIVNHALGDGRPVFASVYRLPRQMVGSGVDDIVVVRIKGHGVEIL